MLSWVPEVDLERALARRIIKAERRGLAVVLPILRAEGYAAADRSTSALVGAVASILTSKVIDSMWSAAGRQASDRSLKHWLEVGAAAGIASRLESPRYPDDRLDAWIAENIERTTDLRDSVGEEYEDALRAAEKANKAPETFAGDLESLGIPARNGRLGGRGDVIAGDQLYTLAAGIARHQQKAAGVPQFEWVTMRDADVRDAHVALDGTVWDWDDPPSEGLPGEPVNCRCRAGGVGF